MAGAPFWRSKACLRSGCGFTFRHIPSKLYEIIQLQYQAIVDVDNNNQWYSHNPNVERSAIGIVPD